MFPPHGPSQPERNACFCGGATPTQPSIGASGETAFAIELPLAIELVVELCVAEISRAQSGGHDPITRSRRIAIQSNAIELDGERIAGHRALYVERSRFGIATGRTAHA